MALYNSSKWTTQLADAKLNHALLSTAGMAEWGEIYVLH